MEKVLDVYEKDYDPKHPVICFDERPCQLIEDILVPVPVSPGKSMKEDYHYKRNGTCVVLLGIEPINGKRIAEVTETKTKKDYAQFIKKLCTRYKDAQTITLIQDNLNTHNASSFYENFSPNEAFKLMSKINMVYTPKKASWLNMAEIEFSALSKQCLDRRIGNFSKLKKEVTTWINKRNKDKVKIKWQFTKNHAREKFENQYSNIKNL